MKITKFGHCCFRIEEADVSLITDPGMFSTTQNEEGNVDAILITHEHADHYHLQSIKAILSNNPQCIIITNSAVGALLTKEGIASTLVGDGQSTMIGSITIEGFGRHHAVIYDSYGQVENTGFFINKKLYFPGDAFHNPRQHIDVLALPVYGPWMKISEAIDYAKEISPRAVFNMHDAPVKPTANFGLRVAENFLKESGIVFVPLQDGETKEF